MGSYIFAIDPGNIESGWVLCEADSLKPVQFGKNENETLIYVLVEIIRDFKETDFVIEKIMSYGMPVGAEVFETCTWIGDFRRFIKMMRPNTEIHYVGRLEEKLAICHSAKANDATIRQALIDRFAPGVSNYGKGNQKQPGWFHGFRKDIWQAYAVAVTYHDKYMRANE